MAHPYVRTRADLQQAALVQLDALKISADHFDRGQIGEAARMANAVFILAGEGMRNHTSILDAADQKEGRLFRSTRESEDSLGCFLVCVELKKVGEDIWDVRLCHAGRTALKSGRDLTFAKWWGEPIFSNDAVKLTRSDVVRILRDKNGGAHFDPIVSDPQVAQAISGELGLFEIAHPDGTRETVPFGLEFCMRQIATEFWYSLDSNKSFDIPYSSLCEAVRDV